MTYQCPVCGVTDEWGYLRCNHPGCTDGRDRHGRTVSLRPTYLPQPRGPKAASPLWSWVVRPESALIALLALAWMLRP